MGNPPFGRDRPPRVAGAGGGEVSVVVRRRKSRRPACVVVVRRRVVGRGSGALQPRESRSGKVSGNDRQPALRPIAFPDPDPAVLVRCSRYPLPALLSLGLDVESEQENIPVGNYVIPPLG